jgi:glucose/arabinose dehydrogenase
MRKKLIGLVIVMLMITIGFSAAKTYPTHSTTTNSMDETVLQTEIMTRDFDVSYQLFQTLGVHAVIHNVGLVNATNVHWSITLDKGLILLGKQASGDIPVMFPDQSIIVKIPFVLGWGKTHITITASASNANSTNDTGYGKMKGIKVTILPGNDNAETVKLEKTASGLKSPVLLTNAGDGSNRMFIVEKTGQIQIVQNGTLLSTPFLDIKSKLVKLIPFYDERGLLGLAFHPQYQSNGRFFIFYSAPTTTPGMDHKDVIAEYHATADPDVADPASEIILLSLDHPKFNHNAGSLAFGPDGYLYISTGDGGGEGDPHGLTGIGQDINTSLGKILRIDVDHGSPYAIPPDNPFVNATGNDEIYAVGFRNPWRMSFDPETGQLFVADVGQDKWEEIDIVEKGQNYGWRIMEGNHLYDPAAAQLLNINISDLTPPVIDYSHYIGHCIIGGYVYRGTQSPSLIGKYIFADWSDTFFQARGKIFYLEQTGPTTWKRMEFFFQDDKPLNKYIPAMGQDESGEVYVITEKIPGSTIPTGEIWHIVGV